MLLSYLLKISHCIRPLPLLPLPPLPGVGGRTSPVLPPPSWRPVVLGPPGTAPGPLPSVAALQLPLPPPPLFSPSWSGPQSPQLGLSLPWQTPTAAGAASGGRPPGGLGVGLPHSCGGRATGGLPSRVGSSGTAALQPPLILGGPPLLLHGGLLLLLLLQLPHCPLQALPALLEFS